MNQLFQGDNLEILHNMPGGSVDLICTDPPFNTGKDWGAFDDRWEGLDEYLKFMEARVVEMRRVLKDTGSLYLHCDPTASHYLKVMLDGVFGIDNFRNQIVWCYSNSGRPNQYFAKKHDVIFLYTKTGNGYWSGFKLPLREEYINSHFNQVDDNGKQCHIKVGNGKTYYYYPDRKYTPNDWWIDIPALNSMANDRAGYPTQKPLALYARMIKASSNQGDVVLDPFAGSGTTLDAAESLGRKWIGIDIGDEAIEIIQTRLRDRHGLMLNYELIRR